jgi:hypothetical protein
MRTRPLKLKAMAPGNHVIKSRLTPAGRVVS